MSKEKFVDANLVKIRDKLSESGSGQKQETEQSVGDRSVNSSANSEPSSKAGKQRGNAVANEREWKKAVFRRWDEFKNTKKDIVNRLAERIAAIPREVREFEAHANELKQAEEKYKQLLADIDALDDSNWNRHNFTSELAAALKKLENTRIEFMMLSSKSASRNTAVPATVIENKGTSGFIHELNSLSFKQCFRVGVFFFAPLILGILFAVLLWGAIFYFSTH